MRTPPAELAYADWELKPALLPFSIVTPVTRQLKSVRMISLAPCASRITSAGSPVSPITTVCSVVDLTAGSESALERT